MIISSNKLSCNKNNTVILTESYFCYFWKCWRLKLNVFWLKVKNKWIMQTICYTLQIFFFQLFTHKIFICLIISENRTTHQICKTNTHVSHNNLTGINIMANVFANVFFWDVFVIFWVQCFILQVMRGILHFVCAILGFVCKVLKKEATFWKCKQLKKTCNNCDHSVVMVLHNKWSRKVSKTFDSVIIMNQTQSFLVLKNYMILKC